LLTRKLKIGIANHKMLRNISIRYGFIDDYESMRGDSKQSGSTRELIEQRFSSFAKNMKLFYISTPELKEKSNIEPVYLLGDQRKYFIPCPCCGDFITIEWKNIVYDTDENGSLISGTKTLNKSSAKRAACAIAATVSAEAK
jgi:phage terminase large subunit GpA-like protein